MCRFCGVVFSQFITHRLLLWWPKSSANARGPGPQRNNHSNSLYMVQGKTLFPVNSSTCVMTPNALKASGTAKQPENPTGREFPVTPMEALPFAGTTHLLRAVATMSQGQAARTAPREESVPPLSALPHPPLLTKGSDTSRADGTGNQVSKCHASPLLAG